MRDSARKGGKLMEFLDNFRGRLQTSFRLVIFLNSPLS